MNHETAWRTGWQVWKVSTAARALLCWPAAVSLLILTLLFVTAYTNTQITPYTTVRASSL